MIDNDQVILIVQDFRVLGLSGVLYLKVEMILVENLSCNSSSSRIANWIHSY